ncbi:hypothetical protein SAMN04488128_1011519 [Chitinophaga eiseniae]|uniref:Uncharacterized protein n=1 Tax=Chitinophaga eiseniae TaxID=634771 RepID=A0A1T4NB62_9BACT|nr:hypothetical protein SAMN04488128_1011519 [Chitinophaga eiseniae]
MVNGGGGNTFTILNLLFAHFNPLTYYPRLLFIFNRNKSANY